MLTARREKKWIAQARRERADQLRDNAIAFASKQRCVWPFGGAGDGVGELGLIRMVTSKSLEPSGKRPPAIDGFAPRDTQQPRTKRRRIFQPIDAPPGGETRFLHGFVGVRQIAERRKRDAPRRTVVKVHERAERVGVAIDRLRRQPRRLEIEARIARSIRDRRRFRPAQQSELRHRHADQTRTVRHRLDFRRVQCVVDIREAGPADLSAIRAMLLEYADGLKVDLCFQGFTRELAELPGDYVPPRGALYIAHQDGEPVGMVALRGRDDGRAEMKRLYVRPAARGSGLGRQLIEHVIAAARARGYASIVLDTLPVMHSAQRLYEEFGFRDVEPYYHSPIAGTRFMGLDL
jgi:putative acetyltransferase